MSALKWVHSAARCAVVVAAAAVALAAWGVPAAVADGGGVDAVNAQWPLIAGAAASADRSLTAGDAHAAVYSLGSQLAVVPDASLAGEPLRTSTWGRAVPDWATSPDADGWWTFHFARSGDIRVRLVGHTDASQVAMEGNELAAQGVMGPDVSESIVAGDEHLESFLMLEDTSPFGTSVAYELDLPKGVEAVQGDNGPITIRQVDGHPLMSISAPAAQGASGAAVPLYTQLNSAGDGFSISTASWSGMNEQDLVIDPDFSFASTGLVDKLYCYHNYGGACDIDSDAQISDWGVSGTNYTKFNYGRDNSYGLYIGNKSSTSYAANDLLQYRNAGYESSTSDYLTLNQMIFKGHVVNPSGKFRCRALVKPQSGAAQYSGAWVSTNGADFTQTFNYSDGGNGGNGRFGWGGFQFQATASASGLSSNANVCRNQAVANSIDFTIYDDAAPVSTAPQSVSHTATANDIDTTGTHWYKSGDSVNVWYDADDHFTGTDPYGYTFTNATGIGVWQVKLLTNGTARSTNTVCTENDSATVPCNQEYTGYNSLTLNDTNSATQGANTVANQSLDFTQRTSTSSSLTYYYDSVAPSCSTPSDIDNQRIDGIAVFSWTACTDSTSGIDHYLIKIWPDGQAEPSDSGAYGYHSTGSSEAYYNARLGANPAGDGWKWHFKIKAVDKAGNTSTATSTANLGTSPNYATNQVSGATGDQSSTGVGDGMQVGHATGNLSVGVPGISAKGYGADLAASETYNHQDGTQTYSLRQTSGSIDEESLYSAWTAGWHIATNWDRRLIRGDDGSTYGQGVGVSNDDVEALTYVDETGTKWPLTPTDSSHTTYAVPVGLDGATFTRTAASPAGPEGDSYTLAFKGGSTLYFDDYGHLTKEAMANGRSVTYNRDSGNYDRVSSIETDDPGTGGTQLGLTFQWGTTTIGSTTWGFHDSGSGIDRIATITDALGRQVRFAYDSGESDPYLVSVQRFADSTATTPLTETDYDWIDAGGASPTTCQPEGSVRVIDAIDQYVYTDDPATGASNDAVTHHWDICYTSTNEIDTITEAGSASRGVGTGSETIPAVADTITSFDYVNLTAGTSGGGEVMDVTVDKGTSADADHFGEWVTGIDWLGRPREQKKPQESGATYRSVDLTDYTADGYVASSEINRKELVSNPATYDVGDVTTYSYDSSNNVTQEQTDPAASGVPDQTTDYGDYDSDGNAGTESEIRTTFLPNFAYALNGCVDSNTTNGTFKVTTAGTSASTEPTWPSSGTVSSGSVVFTKNTCTPTEQQVTTSYSYDSNSNETEQQQTAGQSGSTLYTCTYYTKAPNDSTGAAFLVDMTFQQTSACPGSADASSRIKGTLTDNTYDDSGWLSKTVTDTSTTEYTYDDDGELTEQRTWASASAEGSADTIIDYTYDGAGRQSRVTTTDPDSTQRNTSTQYTMTGQPTVTTVPNSAHPTGLSGSSPAGDQTTTYYNERSAPYETVQADAAIVTREHDGVNQETFVSVPHAASNSTPVGTTTTYYLSGARATKTDPAGVETDYDATYVDPPGGNVDHPARIDSPVSGLTTFGYTDSGELATMSNGYGDFTYSYDSAGNQIGIEYPSGAKQADTFDAQGNALTRRLTFTPDGCSSETMTTKWTYSADNKVASEDQPTSACSGAPNALNTTNTFDATTGLLSQVDMTQDNTAWTRQLRYAYDDQGRTTTQTLENGASDLVTTYDYEDKSGRLSKVEQPGGIDDTYAYDEQGRVSELKQKKHSDSSWQGGDTYTYDTQSRITARTRRENGSSYQTDYAYDPAGQVVSETGPTGIERDYVYGDANSDSFGTDMQRQMLTVTAAPAGTISTQARVDDIEQCLTSTTCTPGDATDIQEAINDLVVPGTLLDPTALGTTGGQDVARFLLLRNNKSWTATTAYAIGSCIAPSGWSGNHYEVTTAGTSASSEPTWPGSGTVTDGTITWTKNSCTPELVLQSYTYDSSSPSKHQLVQQDDRLGASTYYHYDSLGNQAYRCVNGAPSSCPGAYTGTGSGAQNQTWDELGRPTQLVDDSGNLITLHWNQDQYRLDSWTAGGDTHKLSYDADGHIQRMVVTGTNSWTIDYVYDRQGLQSFYDEATSTWHYLDRSTRGDITAIRDDAGALQATAHYDAYGEVSWNYESGADTTLGDKLAADYDGMDGVVDLGGGLQWMGARIYSAAQARFLSADPEDAPVGLPGGAYVYAANDPVNNADPTGRFTWWLVANSELFVSPWSPWNRTTVVAVGYLQREHHVAIHVFKVCLQGTWGPQYVPRRCSGWGSRYVETSYTFKRRHAWEGFKLSFYTRGATSIGVPFWHESDKWGSLWI